MNTKRNLTILPFQFQQTRKDLNYEGTENICWSSLLFRNSQTNRNEIELFFFLLYSLNTFNLKPSWILKCIWSPVVIFFENGLLFKRFVLHKTQNLISGQFEAKWKIPVTKILLNAPIREFQGSWGEHHTYDDWRVEIEINFRRKISIIFALFQAAQASIQPKVIERCKVVDVVPSLLLRAINTKMNIM